MLSRRRTAHWPLTDDETTGSPYIRTRVPVPAAERPDPFRNPSVWVPTLGADPILLGPKGGDVDMLTCASEMPDIRGILPFMKLGRSSINTHEWHPSHSDHGLGFVGVDMRSPVKNCLMVGESVMPGLGIEGDCVTARQAADLITHSRTGRWPFSKGL